MSERREPWRGEVWRHGESEQGQEYAIVGRATGKSPDGPPDGVVVYRRLGYGEYYVRPLPSFLERFVFVRGPLGSVAAERDIR